MTQKERWIRKCLKIARDRQEACRVASERYEQEYGLDSQMAATERCAMNEARHIGDLIESKLSPTE